MELSLVYIRDGSLPTLPTCTESTLSVDMVKNAHKRQIPIELLHS